MTRTNYHHGALREALMTATLELIESEGIGAVSLRRVARAAGVSPGAPYHHFPDRAALLSALSDEGFTRLEQELNKTRSQAESPTAALPAMLETYVTFARTNPAYFHLMFRPELKKSLKSPRGEEAAEKAFTALEEAVAATTKTKEEENKTLTLTLWSTAHGLASLHLDGHLTKHTENPEQLTNQIATLTTKLLEPTKPTN